MTTTDTTQARVPGAMLALFAFVLTVLLGIGGTSAVALWQQSATATMAVSASSNWGPTITLACTPSNNEKTATLAVTSAQTPILLTIAARRADGTYSPAPLEYPADLTGQKFTLTEQSLIIVANAGANPMTVRVTATFSDLQTSTAEWTLGIASGGKVKCTP